MPCYGGRVDRNHSNSRGERRVLNVEVKAREGRNLLENEREIPAAVLDVVAASVATGGGLDYGSSEGFYAVELRSCDDGLGRHPTPALWISGADRGDDEGEEVERGGVWGGALDE